MIPAISFACENPEFDILNRIPRNSKLDHLVNTKLISFAYFQIGVIQAFAGMYTYFLVLNDFGIRPGTLWGLALQRGPQPAELDVYDQTGKDLIKRDRGEYRLSRYGHSNYSNPTIDNILLKQDAWNSDEFYDQTTELAWG